MATPGASRDSASAQPAIPAIHLECRCIVVLLRSGRGGSAPATFHGARTARVTRSTGIPARIVRRRSVALPFPIKGGRLYLYNSNPLLRSGYRGTTGMKTGYTQAAGRCLVATARRGTVRLGVVLLRSPNPGRQATRLLDRGFAANR